MIALAVDAYGYGRTLVETVGGLVGSTGSSTTTSLSYRYYDPLLTLFELAMIPLEETSKKHNIKLYYLDVITRCPDTYKERIYRTASGIISSSHQRRKQAKELVTVAVRAVRWYDPNQDDSFSQSIRFLFEMAIEGLSIYRETYSEYQDVDTDKALTYIDRAKSFLMLKLKDETNDELNAKIEKQERREEFLRENGKIYDSRNFWVLKPAEGVVDSQAFEMLTCKVAELEKIYSLRDRMNKERNPVARERFKTCKDDLENYLLMRQSDFIAKYPS